LLRLILNLRFVNNSLEIPSDFKYESIHAVTQLAKPRDLFSSVALKSGYHHIEVAPEFWQYLGFKWEGQYYAVVLALPFNVRKVRKVFCQLPSDLAIACFDFLKVMKQLVQQWRRSGIRLIPYIVDFLFICSSFA
jgi:hypothetical protein